MMNGYALDNADQKIQKPYRLLIRTLCRAGLSSQAEGAEDLVMKSAIKATTEEDSDSPHGSPEASSPPTPAELADIVNEDAIDATVALDEDDEAAQNFKYPSRRTSLSDTLYIDLTTLTLSLRTTFGAKDGSRRGSITDISHSGGPPPCSDYDVTTARAYIMYDRATTIFLYSCE